MDYYDDIKEQKNHDNKLSKREIFLKKFDKINKKFKIIANICAIILGIVMVYILIKNSATLDISNKIDYDLYNQKLAEFLENETTDDTITYSQWIQNSSNYNEKLLYIKNIEPQEKISDELVQNSNIMIDGNNHFETARLDVYSLEGNNVYLVVANSPNDPWINLEDYKYQEIDMVCISQNAVINFKDSTILIGLAAYTSNNSANLQEDNNTQSTTDFEVPTTKKKDEVIYSQFNGTIWGTVLDDYIEYKCYNDFNNINVDGETYKMEYCNGIDNDELMLSPVIYEGQHITTTAELREIQEVYSDEDNNIKILKFIFYEDEVMDLYVLCNNFDFTNDFFRNCTYYSIYGVCHFTYYEDYVVPYINCYYIEGLS